MALNPSHLRLIDGPLMDNAVPRHDMVARMAKDLVQFEASANERDAIRSLFGRGYAMADIVMLVEDAMFEARQAGVAAAMASPKEA
jgi:hypothetical protein